jgi:hypothetical protein
MEWMETYSLHLVRQNAIRLARSRLGMLMGEKYQNVVLRCLRSDFSIPHNASEPEWLKAFNWLVVKEIEDCCV